MVNCNLNGPARLVCGMKGFIDYAQMAVLRIKDYNGISV